MKATLYKFVDENNIKEITSVNVMHHSTAVEKLRNTIENDADRLSGYCKIKTETYTAEKSIKSFFDSIKRKYSTNIKVVITVTCTTVGNNVREYYITCSDNKTKPYNIGAVL